MGPTRFAFAFCFAAVRAYSGFSNMQWRVEAEGPVADWRAIIAMAEEYASQYLAGQPTGGRLLLYKVTFVWERWGRVRRERTGWKRDIDTDTVHVFRRPFRNACYT